MNERNKNQRLLSKLKQSESHLHGINQSTNKSFSGNYTETEFRNPNHSFSGQLYSSPPKKDQTQTKPKYTTQKYQTNQSIFPKLNTNQPKKAETEIELPNYLPPINVPIAQEDEGEEPLFQLPDDEIDNDSMPSGLVLHPSAPLSPKMEKTDPFSPITMEDSSPYAANSQLFDQIYRSTLTQIGTPLVSPNSTYCSTETQLFYSDYDEEESEEEEYIMPAPSYDTSSVVVHTDENHSVTIPLPLNLVKQRIPDDGSLPPLPRRLAKIVKKDKTAVSYLALCGIPVDGYQPKLLKQAIHELNQYEKQCIHLGYTSEARFVNDAIQAVKADLNERENTADLSGIYEVEDKLLAIDTELTQKKTVYNNTVAKMKAEKEIALRELELECNDDLDDIDKEWTSVEKTKLYNKASVRLQNLRKEAATLLQAKRFDEAAMVNELADKIAEEEAEASRHAMQEDYSRCLNKRQEKYENDVKALESSFERKMTLLQREKQKMDSILMRRREKLVTQKENLEVKALMKQKPKTRQPSPVRAPMMRKTKDISMTPNKGLSIKPLSKLRRYKITKR